MLFRSSGKNKESEFISTSRYFEESVKLKQKYGIEKVRLISDSEEFIAEFLELNESYGKPLATSFELGEMRRDGYPSRVLNGEIVEDEETVKNEYETALRNLSEMFNSSYLVGTHASWFFQLARRLRISSGSIDGKCVLMETDNQIPGRPSYLF